MNAPASSSKLDLHLAAADSFYQEGLFDLALDELSSALSLEPTSNWVRFLAGRCCNQLGLHEEAARHLESELHPVSTGQAA